MPETPYGISSAAWQSYRAYIVRLGLVYLAGVALLAGIVAAAAWPAAVVFTWSTPAVLLLGAYARVGWRAGVFERTGSAVVGVLVAALAVAAFAFVGLIVAVNIWLTTGRGF